MEDILLYFSVKYKGDFQKILTAIQDRESVTENQIKEVKKDITSNYITILSPDYPKKLKEILSPPFVLFYKGDLSVIDKQVISIAGTRSPSKYGKECTDRYVEKLAKDNLYIVTGMQAGIETKAIQKMLEMNKENKTITVMPCGIDKCYPPQNQLLFDKVCKNGLILSEFPDGVSINQKRAISRLRIIAGCSDILLLTETKSKSKQYVLAGYTLEQGKDIYAIPGSILEKDYQGNNELIQNGAYLTVGPHDISIEQTLSHDFNMSKNEIDFDK